MERFIPVECFRKKVIPSEVFIFLAFFPEFPEISVPFVHNYQCQTISEKTAMPMTDCSTQGEKDLSFGRWFFCFTLAS